MECNKCGTELVSLYLQLLSDDDCRTMVLSCPIHGVYHGMLSKYNRTDVEAHTLLHSPALTRSITPASIILNQNNINTTDPISSHQTIIPCYWVQSVIEIVDLTLTNNHRMITM
jgi:hypothetical protein